jgi:hypothetical protein
MSADRQKLFLRVTSLDNGISVLRLEQTWNKKVLDTGEIQPADLKLLKKLGLKASACRWLLFITKNIKYRLLKFWPALIM